jgi:hypothetical protein
LWSPERDSPDVVGLRDRSAVKKDRKCVGDTLWQQCGGCAVCGFQTVTGMSAATAVAGVRAVRCGSSMRALAGFRLSTCAACGGDMM